MEEVKMTARINNRVGSFEFRIEGYSLISKVVGEEYASPHFPLCGSLWQLKIFPGGANLENNSSVGCYLYNLSPHLVHTRYKVSIKNQVESKPNICIHPNGEKKTFDCIPKSNGWGFAAFCPIASLTGPDAAALGLCVADTVIFRVDLTVFDEQITDTSLPLENNDKKEKPETLSNHLLSLWENDIGCDVTLKVGESDLDNDTAFMHAHKAILMARSPVFKVMFQSEMIENQSNEVTICDFSPADITELLHFMYTDTLKTKLTLDSVPMSLLQVAIKYEVMGLVALLETHFTTVLMNDESVMSIVVQADACGAEGLKRKAIKYITSNATRLATRPEFGPFVDRMIALSVSESDALLDRALRGCDSDAAGHKRKLNEEEGGEVSSKCTVM